MIDLRGFSVEIINNDYFFFNSFTCTFLTLVWPPITIDNEASKVPNSSDLPTRDEVVLLKTVLSNFRPKQPNESIGGPRASIFELFTAILTWPNLTGLNRPLSPFFHPLTLPGYPLFCCLFSENWKMEIKRSGVKLLNFLLVA